MTQDRIAPNFCIPVFGGTRRHERPARGGLNMVYMFRLPVRVQNFDDVQIEALKTANFDVCSYAMYFFAASYNDPNMSVGKLILA